MTRAKDCLYTFGYKGKFDWLTNAGVVSSSSDNVWGISDYGVTPISISKPEDSKEDSMAQTYTIVEKPTTHSERERKFLSPSKITEFSGYISHESWKEKGTSIETRTTTPPSARVYMTSLPSIDKDMTKTIEKKH